MKQIMEPMLSKLSNPGGFPRAGPYRAPLEAAGHDLRPRILALDELIVNAAIARPGMLD